MRHELGIEKFQDIEWLVRFDYQSPYQTFNRNLVFGKLSTLFKVKNVEMHSVALN